MWHSRIPLVFSATRVHRWLMINLLSTRTRKPCSTELLSSRSSLNLYWCIQLFLPRDRTLHLPLFVFLITITSHSSYTNKKTLTRSGQNSFSIFTYLQIFWVFSCLIITHITVHLSWATAIPWNSRRLPVCSNITKPIKSFRVLSFHGILFLGF